MRYFDTLRIILWKSKKVEVEMKEYRVRLGSYPAVDIRYKVKNLNELPKELSKLGVEVASVDYPSDPYGDPYKDGSITVRTKVAGF